MCMMMMMMTMMMTMMMVDDDDDADDDDNCVQAIGQLTFLCILPSITEFDQLNVCIVSLAGALLGFQILLDGMTNIV